MANMVLKTTMLPLEDVTVFVILVVRYYLKTFQIFKKGFQKSVEICKKKLKRIKCPTLTGDGSKKVNL